MTREAAARGHAANDPAQRSCGLMLGDVDAATLAELLRALRGIDHSYRAAAENMGQLYMFADGKQEAALTRRLDQPMRNASQNERDLAALLDELQVLSQAPTRKR